MFETGMDISTLEETERLGGRFYENGAPAPLFDLLKKYGTTSIRLRLWNDPFGADGSEYGAGTCDIGVVLRTARRAAEYGMNWMLDFHYSDFWADPGRQLIPKAWQGYDIDRLAAAVYEYTRDILKKCRAEGLYPAYTQIGNEITNGVLWPLGKINYDEETGKPSDYGSLMRILRAGSLAARESGDTRIIYHLERSGDNERYRHWFDAAVKAAADFDIIGVSYYPHWHGNMEDVRLNLEDVSARYDKDVMLVETSYPFTGKHYCDKPEVNLVINESMIPPGGEPPPYPFSTEGQRKFVAGITAMARSIKRCRGLYYWEPAWLALPGSTWSTPAARRYMNEEHKQGGNEWANQCLFDYEGNLLPAIKELA